MIHFQDSLMDATSHDRQIAISTFHLQNLLMDANSQNVYVQNIIVTSIYHTVPRKHSCFAHNSKATDFNMTIAHNTSKKGDDDEDKKLPAKKKQPAAAKHSPPRSLPILISPPPRYSMASPSKTSTASNNTKPSSLPGQGLLAFGMRPACSSYGTFHDKNSTLKCCVIRGVTTTALVFRVQPNDSENPGAWGEQCFFAAIRFKKDWVSKYMVDTKSLRWYQDNVPQFNPNKFPIRLFVIRIQGPPPSNDHLLGLGNDICMHLNATEGNRTTTIVEQASYFWLPDAAVWADVIGDDAALTALIREAGPPCDGYYDLHEATILTFFHPGSFSLDLARTLHAPNHQIHESQRQQLEQHVDMESD